MNFYKLTASNANAFASTFYFFQRSMLIHEKIKRACKQPHTTVHGFVRTSNSGAMNVNRFEQSVCGLRRTSLRIDSSGDADNIKIKRNKFFWGFVRNLKVCASNLYLWFMKVYRYLSPKKIYFFNPFFVIGNPMATVQP